MSVLGLDSGYRVKYHHLPSGLSSGSPSGKGVYLTVYPLSRPNTDTIWINKNTPVNSSLNSDILLSLAKDQ